MLHCGKYMILYQKNVVFLKVRQALERYPAGAGTVSGRRWNGIRQALERYQFLGFLGLPHFLAICCCCEWLDCFSVRTRSL